MSLAAAAVLACAGFAPPQEPPPLPPPVALLERPEVFRLRQSPDGRLCAWLQPDPAGPEALTPDRVFHLAVAAPDGSGLRVWKDLDPPIRGRFSAPVWSPEGSHLALTARRGDLGDELLVVPLQDGAAPRSLLAGGLLSEPVWHPEGSLLAVAWQKEGIQIVVADPGRGLLVQKHVSRSDGFDPAVAWEPGGGGLLVLARGQLLRLPFAGGRLGEPEPLAELPAADSTACGPILPLGGGRVACHAWGRAWLVEPGARPKPLGRQAGIRGLARLGPEHLLIVEDRGDPRGRAAGLRRLGETLAGAGHATDRYLVQAVRVDLRTLAAEDLEGAGVVLDEPYPWLEERLPAGVRQALARGGGLP